MAIELHGKTIRIYRSPLIEVVTISFGMYMRGCIGIALPPRLQHDSTVFQMAASVIQKKIEPYQFAKAQLSKPFRKTSNSAERT
ncbi:MAG: hypothetical protein BGO12_22645 [Verrucomicrobia bacterium 61-8]|nr:MAG: hypothetical protein BGO12_22645 [Verrucomicrobia bacterium 61-8]